jgi:ribosomal protein S24E
MSFNIEILEEKVNPLIDRTEIKFRIDHFSAGTTIIRKIKTHFGSSYDVGLVNIYKNAKELQFYEPFHIQVRNLPKDTREEIYKLKKRKEPYNHLFEYE